MPTWGQDRGELQGFIFSFIFKEHAKVPALCATPATAPKMTVQVAQGWSALLSWKIIHTGAT